jgi:lipid A ethanolaminephosphotransferase
LADDLAKSAGFDMTCLAKRADASYSHDNIFHSVLGLMDVATNVYDPALDIFADCRRPANALARAE